MGSATSGAIPSIGLPPKHAFSGIDDHERALNRESMGKRTRFLWYGRLIRPLKIFLRCRDCSHWIWDRRWTRKTFLIFRRSRDSPGGDFLSCITPEAVDVVSARIFRSWSSGSVNRIAAGCAGATLPCWVTDSDSTW